MSAEIINGIIRVESSKTRAPDPNGENPVCMNAPGTWSCERCGGDVRENRGACPAVPCEQRWRAVDDGRTDLADQVNLLTGLVEPPPRTDTLTEAQLGLWVREERVQRSSLLDGFDDFGPTSGDFGDR